MTKLKDIPGDHTARVMIPGQATAGTDDSWPVLVSPGRITVTGVKWTPKSAVTANDTNNDALQVINKGAANAGTGAVTTVRTHDVATGSSVANTVESFTIGAAPDAVAGDVLALVRTHNGTGLALPQGLLEITFKYR